MGLRGHLFRYLVRLAGSLTPARLINLLKLWVSMSFTRITGRYWHAGYPSAISVEPTNRCQLRCPGCPSGRHDLQRPGGILEPAVLRSLVDQAHKHLILMNLFFQGEPLLHPDLPDMISYAARRKIYTMVSTNGGLLDADMAKRLTGSQLSHLIISIDGMTEEVYQAYRVGGSLEAVMRGLQHMVSAGNGVWRRPLIELQFVVTRANEHQTEDFLRWARSSGADLWRLKSAQIDFGDDMAAWVPENPKWSRYEVEATGEYRIKSRLANHCRRVWSTPVLTWDGRLLPCCFDKQARHTFGNFQEDGLRGTWKNKKAGLFRRLVFRNRKSIGICTNCTEGLRV